VDYFIYVTMYFFIAIINTNKLSNVCIHEGMYTNIIYNNHNSSGKLFLQNEMLDLYFSYFTLLFNNELILSLLLSAVKTFILRKNGNLLLQKHTYCLSCFYKINFLSEHSYYFGILIELGSI